MPGEDEIRMSEIAREVLHVNLEDEMRKSYLDYAMSVIVGRALPDVRDGLKPVHRRVLQPVAGSGSGPLRDQKSRHGRASIPGSCSRQDRVRPARLA